MAPTRIANSTAPTENVLCVSLELSSLVWKTALQDWQRDKPSIRNVRAEVAHDRFQEVIDTINEFKVRWQLDPNVRVVVLYEAGQDGFWIARALIEQGIEALVCDPASIPVERQARRAKTDRLDAIRLVSALRGWLRGERDRMKVISMPSVEAEAQRHLMRDRGTLQKEVNQHRDRISKLLRTVGCWEVLTTDVAAQLASGALRCHDGTPLPAPLYERLNRECERLAQVKRQFDALEKSALDDLPVPVVERITQLQRLKGVGRVGAERLVLELFWRQFENRRQVGSCVGLVPQPYDSGQSRVDQGISKQGNRRVRALLVEMAWMWLRYQPDSDLTKWFVRRTEGIGENKRSKRIAIVAVARRLTIDLWRYLEAGVIPAGAALKPVSAPE